MIDSMLSEDKNPTETREWLDSLESVLAHEGVERATFLLKKLAARMTQTDGRFPYPIITPYRNTIPVERQVTMPGDMFMERRIRSLTRWNALAMVLTSPYLRLIAVMTLLLNIVNTNNEWLFDKMIELAHLEDKRSYYADFYLWQNILAAVIQFGYTFLVMDAAGLLGPAQALP